MKTLPVLLIVLLIAAGCQSSKTMLRKGHYEKAMNKSLKKVRKNTANQKEIPVLEESYKKAMAADSMRIIFLKKEGRPDNWDEIFNLYTTMKERQDKVRSLPKLRITDKNFKTLRTVDFYFRSYDDEIIQSKQKAAEYYYAHALMYLEKGGRENARDAYYELKKITAFYPDYKDVDTQLQKAKEQGTSKVLLKVRNEANVVIPRDLEEDLLKISPGGMEDKWVRYYTSAASGQKFDFYVLINLRHIDVSPEAVKESQFSESREIQDGWIYVKDSRGNVMKDSLGNDIKTPKIVLISCTVLETLQKKSARISGKLEFIDAGTNSLLRSFPLTAESFFEHFSAVPNGDPDALKPESRKRLGGRPMPFPGDLDMIYQAGSQLKDMAKGIVVNNDGLLK